MATRTPSRPVVERADEAAAAARPERPAGAAGRPHRATARVREAAAGPAPGARAAVHARRCTAWDRCWRARPWLAAAWRATAGGLAAPRAAPTASGAKDVDPAHRRDGLGLLLLAAALVSAGGAWWHAGAAGRRGRPASCGPASAAGALLLPVLCAAGAWRVLRHPESKGGRGRLVVGWARSGAGRPRRAPRPRRPARGRARRASCSASRCRPPSPPGWPSRCCSCSPSSGCSS